jgi:nucleoid DNA-binding protein
MEVYVLNNKLVVTKENLINIISNKCEDDFVSTEDLIKLFDKLADRNGTISKKKLIKSIKSSHTKTVIKDIYNTFEDIIFDMLSSVDKKQDVCIKLFEGISLDGKYTPEKTKQNNLTGQTNFVGSRIKPKFNITRSYCDKLNNK